MSLSILELNDLDDISNCVDPWNRRPRCWGYSDFCGEISDYDFVRWNSSLATAVGGAGLWYRRMFICGYPKDIADCRRTKPFWMMSCI